MKVYDAANIRNVALVGHTGSGKTQLASAILSDAGMINRFGKVDEGTTVTDYDEEEIARKEVETSDVSREQALAALDDGRVDLHRAGRAGRRITASISGNCRSA